MKNVNHKGQLFGGILTALRPATLEELEQYNPKTVERDAAGQLCRTKNNRNRIWMCTCSCCHEMFTVRSDQIRPNYHSHQCPESSPGMQYLKKARTDNSQDPGQE